MCLPPDCLLVQGDEDRPDGRLCRCTWNFAFAAWGRPELLERRIDWHLLVGHGTRHRTPTALRWRPRARQAGPGTAGRAPRQRALLIWQQSHPLRLMERSTRGRGATEREQPVARYPDLVEETAMFMASFVDNTAEDPTFELP